MACYCLSSSTVVHTTSSGMFLRIGPNPKDQEAIDHKSYHFFSGDGVIHGIELNKNFEEMRQVTYRRKFVATPHATTGQDVIGAERGGMANTAMVFHNKRLLALEEGSKPYAIALPTLDTSERFTFDGKLTHNVTAHPKVCPETHELMFFGYTFTEPTVLYSVADANGLLLRTIPVDFRRPVMSHDMAVTRNYTVLMDFPLWSFTGPTRVEDRSRFGILPRHAKSSTEVRWFDGTGLYGYHTANCFERPDSSVLELIMIAGVGFSFQRRYFCGAFRCMPWPACSVVRPVFVLA
jgi:carotenoid cleavage dioxygenase-like enzyme